MKLFIVQVAVAAAVLAGCGPPRQDMAASNGSVPGDPPAAQALLQAHNDSLSRLGQLHATGVVELSWRDDQGTHHDQGDIELWLRRPTHTAIRIHKSAIGEEFLWLGTDGTRFWVFDRRKSDEVDANIGSIDDELAIAGSDSPVLRPKAFLDLCGLSNLEPIPGEAVTFDASRNAWIAPVQGQSNRLQAFFDARSRKLSRIEMLDSAAEVIASSEMKADRYAAVPIDSAPLGAYPVVPTLINIATADGSDEVLVSLDEESLDGRQSQAFTDRVFDLELLMKRFRPVRVNGDLVASSR